MSEFLKPSFIPNHMAKQAILDVLSSTIGRYTHLDPTSLSVSLFSGKISLTDLALNPSAINDEFLGGDGGQFSVVAGSCGSVNVNVPWSRISSKSVEIKLKNLVLCVTTGTVNQGNGNGNGDSNNSNSKASREDVLAKENKKRLMNRALLQGMNSMDEASSSSSSSPSSSSSSSSKATFAERLIRRIIENLHIEVENIHIRFLSTGSSTGIFLKSFALLSTDEFGTPKFVDRDAKSNANQTKLFKQFELNDVAVYCDDGAIDNDNAPTNSEMISMIEAQHSFVLHPTSFNASFVQSEEEPTKQSPRYLIKSNLSSLSMLLSKNQLKEMHCLLVGSTTGKKSKTPTKTATPLFPSYRPTKRPTDKPSVRLWWRYAVRCIGRLSSRRSWYEFLLAFRVRKKYVTLYIKSRYSGFGSPTHRQLTSASASEGDYDYHADLASTYPHLPLPLNHDQLGELGEMESAERSLNCR